YDPGADKPNHTSALQYVRDEEIYPRVPADIDLTIAPKTLDDTSAFVKRPGLSCYETTKGSDFVPRAVLDETIVMEQISKSPRPHFIKYFGCHVKRGRITAILLERLTKL
ncbi:Serine/threonine-protein kinase/endoribonuclease IRE2, partial [Tolypocladium capitatum]